MSLIAFCKTENILAGSIVSSVGSLTQSCLRFADQKQGFKQTGPFEIVALSGTLSVSGLHIHLALADGQGAMCGGHLLEGCVIHTTCELVILEQKQVQFLREHDAKTGYPELVIKPRH